MSGLTRCNKRILTKVRSPSVSVHVADDESDHNKQDEDGEDQCDEPQVETGCLDDAGLFH